jgi:hypothetical protein
MNNETNRVFGNSEHPQFPDLIKAGLKVGGGKAMRTIKFKGLAYSGGWVYGNYIHSKRFAGAGNEHRIHCQDTGLESDVIPETVGQFTELQDSKGVDIYEGDICIFTWEKPTKGKYYQSSDATANYAHYAYWVWHNQAFRLKSVADNKFVSIPSDAEIIVIGNIH